jgi:hypothetical protein
MVELSVDVRHGSVEPGATLLWPGKGTCKYCSVLDPHSHHGAGAGVHLILECVLLSWISAWLL